MDNAVDNLGLEDALLHLRKLEDDANESSQISLGFNAYRLAKLKAVKCDFNDVFV